MDCRVIYFPFFQKKRRKRRKKGKIREDRKKIMVNKGRIMDKESKFKKIGKNYIKTGKIN